MVDLKTKKKRAFKRWKCNECYAYKSFKGINKCSALKLKSGGILDLTFDEPYCYDFEDKSKYIYDEVD